MKRHRYFERDGYAYGFCRDCFALEPSRAPCLMSKVAPDELPSMTDEEKRIEQNYLKLEREAIQAS